MISAKVIADSVAPHGKRITTFELEYPRFILAEVLTHRVFSRNTASSRAIPVAAVIRQIQENPAMPVHWGKNQSGMVADEEISDYHKTLAQSVWLEARDNAIRLAEVLSDLGVHKQLSNRLLECWFNVKQVVTSTEFDNFFHLRRHKDAQPEFKVLADEMWKARDASMPRYVDYDEWHLPYVTEQDRRDYDLSTCQKLSASLCAQVSYRKSDESAEKAIKIWDRLVGSEPKHSSPMEHAATPLIDANDRGGNFFGWKQLRQFITNNTCTNYAPEN